MDQKHASRTCLPIPAVFLLISLACGLPAVGGTATLENISPASIPSFTPFGDLVTIRGNPIMTEVGPGSSEIQLGEGVSIKVPTGAFSSANQLKISRLQIAFDQIAPDVQAGTFYVISTQQDVTNLGAPVILAIPRPGPDVTVVRYLNSEWYTVQVEPGDVMLVPIYHFSQGIFGFFEWWSERDVALGEAIEGMDNTNPASRMRTHIEAGDQNVHSFFGVSEQSTQTDTEMCADMISLLQQYNTPANRQFPETSGSTSDMLAFLHAGSSPSEVSGPYWHLTYDSMDTINSTLLATEGQVNPAQFLKIAIDANSGNIPLGVLAAHNYLKEITYKGRNAYSPASGLPAEYGEPASHLASWREGDNITSAGEYDKMGPIYHIFAAMTGGLWLPTRASGPVIATGEAFLRTFRNGGDRPDTQKASADQCGIDAADWLRTHPAEEQAQPPVQGQQITVTGTLEPVGLNPGHDITTNTITITFWTDGSQLVTGSAKYASYYDWEECGVALPSSTRWELTGVYDPVTHTFEGEGQEYGAGQITYTNCNVGDVPEYLSGQGITWEATLTDGTVTGSITLIQSGGTPLLRVTFTAK
jgi:hypothetical protein